MIRGVLIAAVLCLAPWPVQSQGRAGTARPDRAGAPPAARPQEVDSYSYRADGRRDPFMSLIGSAPEPRASARRGDGLAGLTVEEITVRGVIQSGAQVIAMVHGADTRTYLVHVGERLADGVVTSVTAQGLVVLQDVHDPLAPGKRREVRKLLRSLDDAKE
jgi:Tfp pilus assembly protein PilP